MKILDYTQDGDEQEWRQSQIEEQQDRRYLDSDEDEDTESGDWGDIDPQGGDGLGSGNEPTAPGSAV